MHSEFDRRLESRREELEALFLSLYPAQREALRELLETVRRGQRNRPVSLKTRDRSREDAPDWYKGSNLLGMCLYVDQFAGTLRGVREKLPYLLDCGVTEAEIAAFREIMLEPADKKEK